MEDIMEYKYCHLRKVESEAEHNMEYIMEQLDGRIILVKYGRYGSTLLERKYPMKKWDSLKEEKIKGGYTDITDLKDVSVVSVREYKAHPEPLVEKLVKKLMGYANQYLKENYSVSYAEVTFKMIDKAQELINSLGLSANLEEFNKTLEELFVILPRKMKVVKENLAASENDYKKIVEREQELLDAMATKVDQTQRHSSSVSEKEITILEEMGLEARPCNEDEIKQIKKFLGESSDLFDSAFYVKNIETEKKFNNYCKWNHIDKNDIHFFYHGSKNQNFWSILCTGLKLRPNAPITGKIFGHGIYFAPLARKSIGYTSLDGSYWAKGSSSEGYLAVFKVAYKKPWDVYSHEGFFTKLHYDDVAKRGFDAMFAHAGTMLRNDEVIVYREEQCTVRYLIKLKNKK